MTKKCSQCNSEKKLNEFFGKTIGKYGKQPKCKTCDTLNRSNYRKTKKGIISQMYSTQKGSSIKRKHLLPTYSKKDLTEWLFSKPEFHILYDNWKRLDYQQPYVPSVDRIDSSLGYTLHNIQIVTWAINRKNANNDRKKGLDSISKSVNQYSKDGKFLRQYCSIIEASRKTNIDSTTIGNCCGLKTKTIKKKYITKCMSAGGYMWKYSKDNDCSDISEYNYKGKSIMQYTKDNIFIASYNSAYEASKELGICRKSISNCCLKKTKSSGGYVWKFAPIFTGITGA